MHNFRQAKKKQTTIHHTSPSLHLIQISKFIQQYLNCQQKYLINYSTSVIRTHVPNQSKFNLNVQNEIQFNVPYVQSEHYQSNETYNQSIFLKTSPKVESQVLEGVLSSEKRQSDQQEDIIQLKFIKNKKNLDEQFPMFLTKDFTKNPNNKPCVKQPKQTQNYGLCLNNNPDQDIEDVYRLQETAYFNCNNQIVQKQKNSMIQTSQFLEDKQNTPNKNNIQSNTTNNFSKKAIFLNKIQKQKSRKQIAESINRQKHYVNKFLK